ncbi:MAG: type II secretion system protein [Campylobacterota bacterium]|nr:type II secretion system protein [Campylobacterota bacterium]
MQKSFSLFELLLAVVLISVIAGVAVSKISLGVDKTVHVKAKADIALIRTALNAHHNKMLLKQQSEYLSNLDDASTNTANEVLFTKVINDALFMATSKEELKQGLWIKTSNTQYEFVLSNENQIEFSFDNRSNTFECDLTDEYCQELIQ